MAWGWGALIGAGAALIGGLFTGGGSWALLPVLAGGGAACGAGTVALTEKVIKSFGDTPANELKSLGIDPTKLHEEAKEYRERRREFLEDKNKEDKKELAEVEKKINSLDESINNLATDIAKIDIDPGEKAQKMALMNQQKEQKTQLIDKADEIRNNIKKRDDKIEKVFQDLEDPTKYTKAVYEQRANSPYWKSWINWGIIISAVIVFGILIASLRRFLNNVVNSFRS